MISIGRSYFISCLQSLRHPAESRISAIQMGGRLNHDKKNWEPAELGAPVRAMEITPPRSCFRLLINPFWANSPP